MRITLFKTLTLTLTVALLAGAAVAKDKPFKKSKPRGAGIAMKCPPGLAKKSPACVPPGQAKKRHGVRRGDRYDGSGSVLRDYRRYDLPRLGHGKSYYRLEDTVIAVNDDTRLVSDVIGIVSRASN